MLCFKDAEDFVVDPTTPKNLEFIQMRTEATAPKGQKMCNKKGENWKKHKSGKQTMEGGGRKQKRVEKVRMEGT